MLMIAEEVIATVGAHTIVRNIFSKSDLAYVSRIIS